MFYYRLLTPAVVAVNDNRKYSKTQIISSNKNKCLSVIYNQSKSYCMKNI